MSEWLIDSSRGFLSQQKTVFSISSILYWGLIELFIKQLDLNKITWSMLIFWEISFVITAFVCVQRILGKNTCFLKFLLFRWTVIINNESFKKEWSTLKRSANNFYNACFDQMVKRVLFDFQSSFIDLKFQRQSIYLKVIQLSDDAKERLMTFN